MAATLLTPVDAVSPYGAGPGPGVAEAAADAVNGNGFPNDGRTFLIARNSAGAPHTVTIQGKSFSVAGGQSVVLGPFPVFQQHGTTATVTASDAALFLTVVSIPDDLSAKR
jgi:hypothetical protein